MQPVGGRGEDHGDGGVYLGVVDVFIAILEGVHVDVIGSAQKAVQPLCVSDVLMDGDNNLLGLLGPNSIEKFWLEKPLEFWLEIPYTKKMFKNG